MDSQGNSMQGEGSGKNVGADFFRQAVINSALPLLGVSKSGEVVFANDAACRLFHTSPSSLMGAEFSALIAAEGRPMPPNPGDSFEAVGIAGSHLVPLEVSVVDAGDFNAATLRDISSRSALRTIIENMPGAISLFDADLNMLACNSKLRELLDFPEEMFSPKLPNLADLFRYNAERGEYGPGDIEELVQSRIRQAKLPVHHVFERTRINGTVLEVRGAPLAGGGFVTIYTDVTARRQAEEALKDAMLQSELTRLHLHSVIEHLPQGVTVVDQDLNIVVWNSAFARLINLPPEVMPPGEVVPYAQAIGYVARRGDYGPGDPDELVRQRVELAKKFEPHRFERTLPGGEVIEVFGRPMHDGGFVTTYTDITEIRQAARKVEETLQLMDEVLAHAVIAVFELDEQGCFRLARGLRRVLGVEDDAVLGRSVLDFFEASDHPQIHALIDGSLRGPVKSLSARRCELGREVWLSVNGYPVDLPEGGKGFRGVFIDVTEKHVQDVKIHDLIHQLEQSALHDPLTGLANRTKFLQRFDDEIDRQKRSGKTMCLAVADLDHFKAINDTYGHLVGDAVLKEAAKALRSQVRQTDLVARFGGEEFLVLLPETDLAGGLRAAETLRTALEQLEVRLPGSEEIIRVTGTFGVAEKRAGDNQLLDELLEAADQAAYRGKREGRNTVVAAA